MEWLTESTIIQAGGIAVALVAIFAMIYMVKNFSKILGNHLNHQTEMQKKDIQSRELYAIKFTTLVDTIQKYFER